MTELSDFPSDWCFEQAANSGSSRMSQAPNHHLHSKAVVNCNKKQTNDYSQLQIMHFQTWLSSKE